MVVGVIDTGIWPESASFAGDPLGRRRGERQRDPYVPNRSGDTITMTKSDGGTFTGGCQTGEDFTVDDCNTKIVGARYFGDDLAGPGAAAERDDSCPRATARATEATPPRSAAATTGSGPSWTTATSGGSPGVAPAAKIAVYKAVWQAKDAAQSGAYNSDVLAAIDAAIATAST